MYARSINEAPLRGPFDFLYKGVLIKVSRPLNSAARGRTKDFWEWLIGKYYNSKYICLTYLDIAEQERRNKWLH